MEPMVRDALELLKKFDENNNEFHNQQVEPHAPLPLRVGQVVTYRVPAIQSPSQYTWQEHDGVVLAVDSRWQMVTVLPQDEAEPWRMLPWCYVRKVEAS